MGAVDVALEIRRDKTLVRRLVKAYGRADVGGEFLYEKRSDGLMVPFGRPSEVALDEVAQRAIGVLDRAEWRTTREVLERMPPPRPSGEQLRLALIEAARSGLAERDPPIGQDARGKTHRWRRILASGTAEDDDSA